jgi:inner membrane protein
MDPVTQALLGSTAAQGVLQNKLKTHAALIGAIAGMAPDLDIFIRSSNATPLMGLYYHRHFTHSLAFIPIGGLLVALVFLLLFRSLRTKWQTVILASILGYGTHGLLDAFTSYGTVLYWPFSLQRIHWDLVSIVDPIYTAILLVGVVLSLGLNKKRYAILGFVLSSSYLAFNAYLHHSAMSTQETMLKNESVSINNRRVMPILFHPFLWRSLYRDNNQITLANIKVNLFNPNTYHPLLTPPLFKKNQLPLFVKQSQTLRHDYRIFDWFSDGYLTLAKQKPLTLADARYIFGSIHPTALWGIRFMRNKPYIKRVRHIKLQRSQKEK